MAREFGVRPSEVYRGTLEDLVFDARVLEIAAEEKERLKGKGETIDVAGQKVRKYF